MKEFINTKDFYLYIVLDSDHIFLTLYKNILQCDSTPPLCTYVYSLMGLRTQESSLTQEKEPELYRVARVANNTPTPGRFSFPLASFTVVGAT